MIIRDILRSENEWKKKKKMSQFMNDAIYIMIKSWFAGRVLGWVETLLGPK